VGSLFISVGGAIYTHSLRLSKRRMAMAQAAALSRLHETRMAHTRAHAVPVGYHLSSTRIDLEPVGAEQEEEAAAEPPREPWRDVLAALPWKRIALVSLGLFLVVMLIITVFELATGRSVSSYTGGSDKNSSRTSIPGLGGGGSSSGPSPTPGQQASPGQGQASGQSTPTSGTGPQSTPTPGAQPTQQQQSQQARPTPTPSLTPTPTPTHSVSPQSTPSGSAQPQ
jgi:hypothetical protein